MKNRLIIFLSLSLIIVGGFCLGLFFKNKTKNQIVLVDDFKQTTKTISVDSGAKYKNYFSKEENQNYKTYEYYYDKQLTKQVNLESQITSNSTIYVGYIQNIDNVQNIKESGVVGVKYSGEVNNQDLQTICDYAHVEIISHSQLNFSYNNDKIKTLKITNAEKVTGINNYNKLEDIELTSVNSIENCFNYCNKLSNTNLIDSTEISNAFNHCYTIKNLQLSQKVENISNCFCQTNIENIEVAKSNTHYIASDKILYKILGNEFSIVKVAQKIETNTINTLTTTIEDYAFYGCNLQNMSINARIESIGKHAFENSTIQSIDLTQNHNINWLTIEEYAFANTPKLTNVVFGNLLKEIKTKAFINSAIKDIDISNCIALSKLGEYAFANNNILETAKLNSRILDSEEEGLFSECHNLKEVSGIAFVNIPANMFYKCENLQTISGNNITGTIGSLAFYDCKKLENLDLFKNATEIGQSSFENCTSLENVMFNNVSKVCQKAFLNCSNLTSASFIGTQQFDFSALEECNTLQTIEFDGGNYVSENDAVYNLGQTKLCYYLQSSPNQVFEIKSSVEQIESKYLSWAKNLKEIQSNSTNFVCEDGVLYDVTEQKTLICYPQAKTDQEFEIDSTTKTIKSYAFQNCAYLKTITIGSQVEQIENAALKNMNSIVTLSIGYLGQNPSSNNTAFLGYIFGATEASQNRNYVPSSLKIVYVTGQSKYSSGAFMFCDGIYEISIENITTIEQNMFYGCSKLQTLKLSSKIENIKSSSFYGCKNLVNIYLKYHQDLTVSSTAFSDVSQNIKVILTVPSNISPEDIINYKAKFNKIKWIWETKIEP